MTEVELDNGVSSGVTMGTLDSSLVPPYLEHQARLWQNISMDKWYDEMDYMERAFVVAMWRIDKSMKNLQAEAEIRHAKAKARK